MEHKISDEDFEKTNFVGHKVKYMNGYDMSNLIYIIPILSDQKLIGYAFETRFF